jgi:tetratricopeptide (TPR) repeat protein
VAGRAAPQRAPGVVPTAGRRPEDFRDDPDYARLIRLLRGHPRSLEVVLPQLRRRSPAEVIHALQHRIDSLGDVLDASLDYGFGQLSERARRHLPFIGLFTSFVHAGVVANFVAAGDEREAIYREVVGEALDGMGWRAILEEAAGAGLLRPLGGDIYELHPTLPPFLRRRLAAAAGEAGLARLDAEFARFYAALADHFFEGVSRGERNAVAAVSVEEANLLRALRLAELEEEWKRAQAMAQTLGEFYEVQGRLDEWNALRGQLLDRVGREPPPGAGRERANLWMYLLGNEANRAQERHELARAEAAYRSILDYLLSLDDPALESKVAVGYHQLGMIAEERAQFDPAEAWYRQALEIEERLGLERDAASDYHQLGMIAQERGQFEQAEAWYRQALEIFERLGLERYAALDYHQLGRIAQEWGQLDQAEAWYRQALEIYERLGLERDAASDYHQLGNVAYLRQQFDRAEAWYRQALEIFERLGHPPLLVNTLAQMGLLRRDQARPGEAVAWLGRALFIAAKYQMRVTGQVLVNLARLMGVMGEEAFTAAWREAFPDQAPPWDALRRASEDLEGEN